ncbi:MAG: DUF2281 domain-containing protein [Bacteroidales bacterium]|jgi:hypothetical protein|nr:DUF2281 domain-containing protein [Bacteroidales bacterium]
MTQQAELQQRINNIPQKYFGEVIDFLAYLQHKAQKEEKTEPLKERVFGCSKGKYRMSDDFDAPLEDFKDYM